MLDAIVANEGEPQVVQLSGGEPTLHPDFFAVVDLVKARPIKHLMVNTNGLRIAKERDFCDRLSQYQPRIEIYLQFDSFEADALKELRGADLRSVRERATTHLNEFNLSTTLVVTLKKGLIGFLFWQLLYVISLLFWLKRRRKSAMMKGVGIGAL